MASNKGTAKTTSRPEGPLGDKDSGETNHPMIWNQSTPLLLILQELVLSTRWTRPSLLLSVDEMVQESDEEEVFKAGEDMDKDTQVVMCYRVGWIRRMVEVGYAVLGIGLARLTGRLSPDMPYLFFGYGVLYHTNKAAESYIHGRNDGIDMYNSITSLFEFNQGLG
ncbi:hypothetical protein Tco_0195375 [Tanacetum coccineum]